jgi:hypothetical protein
LLLQPPLLSRRSFDSLDSAPSPPLPSLLTSSRSLTPLSTREYTQKVRLLSLHPIRIALTSSTVLFTLLRSHQFANSFASNLVQTPRLAPVALPIHPETLLFTLHPSSDSIGYRCRLPQLDSSLPTANSVEHAASARRLPHVRPFLIPQTPGTNSSPAATSPIPVRKPSPGSRSTDSPRRSSRARLTESLKIVSK